MNKLITILLNRATLFGKILLQVLQKKSFAMLEHLHQLIDVGVFLLKICKMSSFFQICTVTVVCAFNILIIFSLSPLCT